MYVEDLKRGSNADIGFKDVLEMISKKNGGQCPPEERGMM
jgi:hypothetical protein